MSMKEESTDREKADLIRDKLMKWTGLFMANADEVHLVMRVNGKDISYESEYLFYALFILAAIVLTFEGK